MGANAKLSVRKQFYLESCHIYSLFYLYKGINVIINILFMHSGVYMDDVLRRTNVFWHFLMPFYTTETL